MVSNKPISQKFHFFPLGISVSISTAILPSSIFVCCNAKYKLISSSSTNFRSISVSRREINSPLSSTASHPFDKKVLAGITCNVDALALQCKLHVSFPMSPVSKRIFCGKQRMYPFCLNSCSVIIIYNRLKISSTCHMERIKFTLIHFLIVEFIQSCHDLRIF